MFKFQIGLFGIGIYLTQIIGQKNAYHVVDNLNRAGGSELAYIPQTMLPLPVVFLYLGT